MPPLDLLDGVVRIPAVQRHRQPGPLRRHLVLAFADDRMRRQDVVQRRRFIAAARKMADAEVLAMAIGGREQPEDDLREEEIAAIGLRRARAGEDVGDLLDARSAVRLVLLQCRRPGGLAHVFLRQAQQPGTVGRGLAVEALDDQCLDIPEAGDLAGSDRQAKGGDDPGAEPFVFHRGPHVGAHIAHQSHRQLEDMRGRRTALWQQPLPVPAQQRGLFLRAGDGQAQVIDGLAQPEHGLGRGLVQQGGDLRLRERAALDALQCRGRFLRRQHLEGAGAVAAEPGQQREGVGPASLVPGRDAPPDGIAVGQQVVEIVGDHRPTVWLVARRKGQ
ncbi:hypothetical protein D9M72_380100 [compost metagenome]